MPRILPENFGVEEQHLSDPSESLLSRAALASAPANTKPITNINWAEEVELTSVQYFEAERKMNHKTVVVYVSAIRKYDEYGKTGREYMCYESGIEGDPETWSKFLLRDYEGQFMIGQQLKVTSSNKLKMTRSNVENRLIIDFEVLPCPMEEILVIVIPLKQTGKFMLFDANCWEPYYHRSVSDKECEKFGLYSTKVDMCPSAKMACIAKKIEVEGHWFAEGTCSHCFILGGSEKTRVLELLRPLSHDEELFLEGAAKKSPIHSEIACRLLHAFTGAMEVLFRWFKTKADEKFQVNFRKKENDRLWLTLKIKALGSLPAWAVFPEYYREDSIFKLQALDDSIRVKRSTFLVQVEKFDQCSGVLIVKVLDQESFEQAPKFTASPQYYDEKMDFLPTVSLDHKLLQYILFSRGVSFSTSEERDYCGDRIGFDAAVPTLTTCQANAIAGIISEQPIVPINAPPGTGKSTMLSIALNHLAKKMNKKVLILSNLNCATDGIAEKLTSLESFNRLRSLTNFEKSGGACSLKTIRNEEYTLPDLNTDPTAYNNELKTFQRLQRTKARGLPCDRVEHLLARKMDDREYQVVATTIGMFLKRRLRFEWDVCVIDEASLVTTAEFFWLMSLMPATTKFVLLGDGSQLHGKLLFGTAPVCDFEKLCNALGNKYYLDVCFRSTALVVESYAHNYPFRINVDSEAERLQLAHQIGLCSSLSIVTRDTQFDNEIGNVGESRIAAEVVKRIKMTEQFKHRKMLVLCYYKRQKSLMKSIIKDEGVEIRTVDESQGMEADSVVLLTSKTKLCSEFVNDRNRHIVAVSRAKSLHVTIIDEAIAKESQTWSLYMRSTLQDPWF